MNERTMQDSGKLLEGVLEVGVNLSVVKDQRAMLDMILTQARKLSSAEAGTLYVRRGESLSFVAVQNDKADPVELAVLLAGKELPLDGDSLAAFAAVSGQIHNIADTYRIPEGAPYRINRDFDAATGYQAESMQAIPLMCPDGKCVGVLELINHLDSEGKVGPFPEDDSVAEASLASMAAVTIRNSLLQEQLKASQLDCIIRLSVAAEFRDDDSAEHIMRISRTSCLIAETMGLDADQIELIRHASPMHDIGKIGIPDAILRKPGPLTFEERNIVEKHTLIGADILKDPPNPLIEMARDIALTHHERWDGKGYPNGISGEQIPLCGRIVSLADVFDALVSKRCYKEAFALEIALEIMRFEDGKHFDPAVASAFFSILPNLLKFYGDLQEKQ